MVLDVAGERIRVRVHAGRATHWSSPRFSPDGTRLALSATNGTVLVLDIASRQVRRAGVAPADGLLSSPLGWTGDGRIAYGRPPAEGLRLRTLEVTDRGTEGFGGVVGMLPSSGVAHLEIATSLMRDSRTTVERPAPDWPWSIERRAAVGVLSVVAVVGFALFVWTRRRRW